MKRSLLLALEIVLGASVAFGQTGYIGLFSDIAHTSDHLTIDQTGGMKRIYIYHLMAAGTTASMFAIKTQGILGGEGGCALTGITYQFTLVMGDPFFEPPYDNDNAGVAFAYGSCITTGAIYLARINLTCAERPAPYPCAMFTVVPAPDAPTGTIEVVGCADNKLVSNGTMLGVNAVLVCVECHCYWVCPTTSTKESTWGKVKALYN